MLGTALFLTACKTEKAPFHPDALRCEYLINPSVVDVLQPRLSWVNRPCEGERNQFQTAWQIRVASSENALNAPDMWDSEKVSSDQSDRIIYRGKPLSSRQECWWQVRVWDKNDQVSGWSEPAFWRMGLLHPADWQANWIGAPWQGEEPLPRPEGGPDGRPEIFGPPAPLLRKAFSIDKQVEKAVVYTTGLGYFEFYLNGSKVGTDELVPNQTNYGKRPALPEAGIPLPDDFTKYKVMYLAYDIKDMLVKGTNVAGSILGNGFYNPAKFWTEGYGTPRFIAQIHITYSDGTEEVIVTDETWKASESAIVMDMVYYGEYYDARREQPGWCTASFDDSGWQHVVKRNAPFGDLVAHTAYTDKVTETFSPLEITKTEGGDYLVDFGVEISGRLRLNNVTGPAGHKVKIEYICNTYSGDNTYIFRGGEPENYAARFNWFVFSSVKIKNWPGELKAEQLTAEAVNTAIEETAVFETSNSLFNDINKIWKRSQLDNMHGGIASDCPHRERSAYTGDGQVACPTVMHIYDAKNFYYKWIADIRDAQIKSTGYVPNGAPWQPGCGGGVAWGAAIAIMPWEFYLQYGAADVLEDNYEAMKGYVEYMKSWLTEDETMFSNRTGLNGKPLKWFNLGEWAAPGEMPSDEFVHTFYFWYCADIVSKVAGIVGTAEDTAVYVALAETTKKAFHRKFYRPQEGTYGNEGANILALRMGVPDEQYDKVVAAVRANIKANNGHLDTGIFGTRFFFEVLAENGMHDLAYEAMNKRTQPSYGFGIESGATTTWEHWNGSSSQNHPMFGGGLVWFYRNLAGMQVDPKQPGYKHIIFKPQVLKALDFVQYSNMTPYGEAGIRWHYKNDNLQVEITVPVGSKATLYFPTGQGDMLKESGKLLAERDDLKLVSTTGETAIIEVGSGHYTFYH